MRSAGLLAMLVPAALAAQASEVRVVVTDSLGNRVAFAWVQLRSGTPRAADDSGRVTLEAPAADSLALSARRIGYAPFDGKVARDAGTGTYRVMMTPLPQALERLNIVAPQENRLFRNGFYARQSDAARIATPSRFFSPEALEARPVARSSNLLDGIPFVNIQRIEGKRVVAGRGRCAANILLDGKAPLRMVEDILTREGESEIYRTYRLLPPSPGSTDDDRRAEARRIFMENRTSLDDLISPGAIAAMEVYASANQAPVELRVGAKEPNCVLIAIWSGARQ